MRPTQGRPPEQGTARRTRNTGTAGRSRFSALLQGSQEEHHTELRIDIAALPLRRYLAVRSRLLVIQHDRITRLDHVPDPAIDASDRSDLRHFAFRNGDLPSVDRSGFVRLVGKQIVLPIDAEPADLARPHTSERRYPEFTIAIAPNTGEGITSTCEPDKLSNYFTDRGTPALPDPGLLPAGGPQPVHLSAVPLPHRERSPELLGNLGHLYRHQPRRPH
ncbi:hypothetical protein ABZ499_32645 [Streptomyces sp. NPDC019990]|uniref:hypothetical protein n=1 Tax=Streptomyces sp. NPDC019990 TaxID=3154693 RepID=UPI0034119B2F